MRDRHAVSMEPHAIAHEMRSYMCFSKEVD